MTIDNLLRHTNTFCAEELIAQMAVTAQKPMTELVIQYFNLQRFGFYATDALMIMREHYEKL